MRKQFKDFEKKRGKLPMSDIKVFKTEKITRDKLLLEQPPLLLNPDSLTLQGHSIEMANEGLIFNLYDFINNSYQTNNGASIEKSHSILGGNIQHMYHQLAFGYGMQQSKKMSEEQ